MFQGKGRERETLSLEGSVFSWAASSLHEGALARDTCGLKASKSPARSAEP